MFILLLFASALLQRWVWRTLASRELRGDLTRSAARQRFAVAALAPAVLLALVFAGVLAVEETFAIRLVSEPTIRILPTAIVMLGVLGFLVWAVFALRRRR